MSESLLRVLYFPFAGAGGPIMGTLFVLGGALVEFPP
jgi:hypothetical protein